jgi:hypothetical protein
MGGGKEKGGAERTYHSLCGLDDVTTIFFFFEEPGDYRK